MSKSKEPQAGPHSDGIREGHAGLPIYFKVLYFGLVAWAVVFAGYYLFSGWSSGAEFERKMEAHQERVQER
ncbi:hypothetical protein ACHHRT_06315 [Desulfurivibrio sp. D14AmB]|uniref:hypothetical protein n=1 Tax=Desulfurivibrio sp. D14AmB TaxID=3374370 RepID=UPI00376F1A5A